MKFVLVSASILLLGSGLNAQQIDNCSSEKGKDSISCLQIEYYRKARSLFDNPKIEIFEGISLVKSTEGRQGKAMQDNAMAVETAQTVEARSNEMATYLMGGVRNFIAERSLHVNLADATRSIGRAIPDDLKASVRELVDEARHLKKKKSLKKLLPIIKIVAIKVAFLVAGTLLHIFATAKKALFIASISFLLSALGSAGAIAGLFGKFSGLLGGKNAGGVSGAAGYGSSGHTTTYIVSSEPAAYSSSYSSGNSNAGWSSSGSGWDTNGAYSGPVAQYAAYRGQAQAQQATPQQ